VIEGALVFLAGLVGGWLAGRLNLKRRRTYRHPDPICGCKHHFSQHDRTGKCYAPTNWGANWHQCTCQVYTGPQPLPEFFSPEVGTS
jgi:hypothetical protein